MDFLDITISGMDGKGGLQLWENTIAWMYLDSHMLGQEPAPLVTVGIGCAIGLDEALTLPFEVDSMPATTTQIQEDYLNLQTQRFGCVASVYQSCTQCRLPSEAVVALCQSRLAGFVAALRHTFPDFDTWPEPCKAGALDLIYGVGIMGLQNGYPHLIAACRAEDWTTAAAQCAANASIPAFNARNQARRALFLSGLTQTGLAQTVVAQTGVAQT